MNIAFFGSITFAADLIKKDIMIMTHSMIVWSAIIIVIGLAFMLRATEKYHQAKDFRKKHIHLIEMSKEEEMFYCPGDENMEVKDDSEY